MAEKARLTLDLEPALHRQLKIRAAEEGLTMKGLCLEAIKRRLAEARPRRQAQVRQRPGRYLTAKEAPLLAELWDNEEDAVYDNL